MDHEECCTELAELRELSRFRMRILRALLAIVFAGGVLLGLLLSAVGLPGVWWAPVLLGLGVAFTLYLREPRLIGRGRAGQGHNGPHGR